MPTATQSDDNSISLTSSGLDVDEFIPLVSFKRDGLKNINISEEIFEYEEEKISHNKDEDNKLSKHIDYWNSRTYRIFERVTKKEKITFPLYITKGNEESEDDDGIITARLSEEIEGVKITSETDFKASYNSDYTLELELKGDKLKPFYVDFYAKDDEDDDWEIMDVTINDKTGKLKNVHCGRIKIVYFILDQDVFNEDEILLLFNEIKKAQVFNKSGNVVGNGYCINTADRALGALLKDSKEFYTEPNFISQGGNGIRLKSSTSRASIINSLGYIKSNIEVKLNNYNNNEKPTKLQLSLAKIIEKDINIREGYHIYYFSMHGEYHVMLLLVNFSKLKNPIFSILDQGYVDDGINSRNIPFSNLDKTFLTLAQAFWENRNKHAKNILLWKIQRKN